jgi:peptide-methionine (S)-S-oxide reductase
VCTGRTGHAEAAIVVYDPEKVGRSTRCSRSSGRTTTRPLPTGRATTSAPSTGRPSTPRRTASPRPPSSSRDRYQAKLTEAGFGTISTEIREAGPFFYAEDYHQQYLAKNPTGYCNHGFCQVAF